MHECSMLSNHSPFLGLPLFSAADAFIIIAACAVSFQQHGFLVIFSHVLRRLDGIYSQIRLARIHETAFKDFSRTFSSILL